MSNRAILSKNEMGKILPCIQFFHFLRASSNWQANHIQMNHTLKFDLTVAKNQNAYQIFSNKFSE